MSLKTSRTDPIHVFEISYESESVYDGSRTGVIGISMCPGKKGPSSLGGEWDRDLDIDISTLKEQFNPSLVVTLMTDEELKNSKVPDLGHKIESQGMKWCHIPVEVGSALDDDSEEAWFKVVGEVIRPVAVGDRILVHDRGGSGSSGMMAAIILIELGLDKEEAITRVRRVHSGAIDTGTQESYISKYEPVGLPPNVIPYCFAKNMWVTAMALNGNWGGGYNEMVTQRGQHYFEDIAVQYDRIVRCLGINGPIFPKTLTDWCDGGWDNNAGQEWVGSMEPLILSAMNSWYQLPLEQRKQINIAFNKIIFYFEDIISQSEGRSGYAETMLSFIKLGKYSVLGNILEGHSTP